MDCIISYTIMSYRISWIYMFISITDSQVCIHMKGQEAIAEPLLFRLGDSIISFA